MMNYNKMKDIFLNSLLKNNTETDDIKQKYDSLLVNVIGSISTSEIETKNRLFSDSKLNECLKEFINNQKLASGAVLSFGTSKYSKTLYYGNSRDVSYNSKKEIIEDCYPISENSIFDLASVSKVFTCYTVMKLHENSVLDIDAPISIYDNRFVSIKDYTLRQLMSFQKIFATDKIISDNYSLQEAENLLFNIKSYDLNLRPYSDMGAIVVKYVVENYLKTNFFDLVDQYIIKPCSLSSTFINNPDMPKDLFVSNNFERKILYNKCAIDYKTDLGTVHDYKAKILGNFGKEFPGHAGLFSTAKDMIIFSQDLLNEKIISKNLIYKISKNYVGFKDESNNYSQFLGMLCHTKHPIAKQSEVYDLLSDHAVAQGGYTGTYLTYDIDNDIFLFLGANRCHNRITSISKEISPDNQSIANEWMEKYVDTHKYAWLRDELIHKALDLSIQYKFVDYIFRNKSL